MSWFTRGREREADLHRELQDHLDLAAEERVQAGASGQTAHDDAHRAFGSTALVKEDTREAWGWTWVERARQDVRFAARLLIKTPGFTTTTMLTLALAIGATTTIFSQINAVFWRNLPITKPEELRLLVWSSPKPAFVAMPNVAPGPHVPVVGDTYGSFSYGTYVSMRDGARNLIDLGCWADLGETRPVVMRDVGFGTVHFVSGNYFDVLGVHAAVGRVFRPDDDVPGTAAAVISYPFWQRAFGLDPGVTHRTIDLNGKTFSIVGVTPAGFFGVDPASIPDVLVPVNAIQLAAASSNPLQNSFVWAVCRVVGRVRPAIPDEQVRRVAEDWLREAVRAHPPREAYEMPRLWLLNGGQGMPTARDAMLTPLTMLMGVVIAMLLIACANIAGLLIVRGMARQREMATRLALGASRPRLIRQLLTESVLVAVAGGVLGVGVAYVLAQVSPAFLSRLMPTLYGGNRTLGIVVAPDGRVLVFAAIVTMGSCVFFGMVPAVRMTRVSLIASIKQTVGSHGRGPVVSGDKLMVALQAALSLVLLFGAGLLLQTLSNLRSAPLGYKPEGLLYAKVEPRTGGIPTARRAEFFEEAVRRVAGIPGVVSASATDDPPLGARATIFWNDGTFPACTPGYVPPTADDAATEISSIAPRYFETIGTQLVAGREFEWRDQPNGPQPAFVAIVNETFARRFFAGKNPLEQRFGFNCPGNPTAVAVVGVVADARRSPRQIIRPRVYVPLSSTGNVVTLVVRGTGPPEPLIATIRRTMAAFNVMVPTFGEVTPVELREQQMRQERLLTDLVLIFGAVALLLSAIGIYGMLAYLVIRRTRDIGIRIAVGARSRDVIWQVLKEAVLPLAMGLSGGAVVSVVVGRWTESLLFGVSAHDMDTMTAAGAVLLMIALAAAAIPAFRASRIDPLRALRVE